MQMDKIAAEITHYFLSFFHAIGMDSVVYLFGKDAYYCAIGYDRYSSIKSLIMCHNILWIGYLIPIVLIVLIFLRKSKFNI
jgi:hypothetical protein